MADTEIEPETSEEDDMMELQTVIVVLVPRNRAPLMVGMPNAEALKIMGMKVDQLDLNDDLVASIIHELSLYMNANLAAGIQFNKAMQMSTKMKNRKLVEVPGERH